MARAQYLYLIRTKWAGDLRGVFTVKHEAHTWAHRYAGLPLCDLQLWRMRDGTDADKTETAIDWDNDE